MWGAFRFGNWLGGFSYGSILESLLGRFKYQYRRTAFHAPSSSGIPWSFSVRNRYWRDTLCSAISNLNSRKTVSLADCERGTRVRGSHLGRSIRFFMEHPSADIWLDELTKETLTTDIEINLGATKVIIRQFMLSVNVQQSHIKDAELLVAVSGHNIPRSIRYPVSETVTWDVLFEPKSEEVAVQTGEALEQYIPRAVHSVVCKKYAQNLKAGWAHYATGFYTIKGYNNLFLATEKPVVLPLASTYRLHFALAGEGLRYAANEGVYVEAEDWNRIYVNYDRPTIRLWRSLKRGGFKKLSRWLFSVESPRQTVS